MPNTHDKGYRRILTKKKHFISLLHSFIKEDWAQDINEDDIELIDKKFVTKDFRDKEADIIYRVNLHGRQIIFYCLLELQSSVDFTMPFRLLAYIYALLNTIFTQTDTNTRERSDFRLPTVVPIVLYNGSSEWSAVRRFRDYQNAPDIFGTHAIDFSYILLNVNRFDDDELLDLGNLISSVFLLDKVNDSNSIITNLNKIASIFTSLSSDEQIEFTDWLRDVLISRIPKGNKEVIEDAVAGLSMREALDMTYAIERVLDEMIEKSKLDGKLEGKAEGKVELLIQMGKAKDEILSILKLTEDEYERLKMAIDEAGL